jgi:hypothetical protein
MCFYRILGENDTELQIHSCVLFAVRLAYQSPVNSIFLSEQTSHQPKEQAADFLQILSPSSVATLARCVCKAKMKENLALALEK